MEFKRTIVKGMSGNDVLYIKRKLFALGMYSDKIKKIRRNKFRQDSVLATKKFQTENNLEVTGTIYEACWNAIEEASKKPEPSPAPEPPTPTPTPTGLLDEYTWIDKKKRAAIEKDLLKVSEMRRNICLEILKWAYDPEYRKGDVRALYMWGENAYNKQLKPNYATAKMIENGAKKRPQYYDGGRKEWMLEQVAINPYLPGSDCSGLEVGWLRKFKLVSTSFDTNSTRLASTAYSVECTKEEALPATFIHRPGHIGTYVGGGYVVEFVGGAYGCQLTARDKRKVWNFVEGKMHTFSPWDDYWNFKELLKYD